MTALCGGNTSSMKPTTPSVLAFTTAALDVLLQESGLIWLIPFVSAVEAPLLYMSDFCASDPPAFPTLTADDMIALVSPVPLPGTPAARAKIGDIILRLAWYAFCQCDAGPQPTLTVPPFSQPAGAPVVLDAASTLCVPMLRSQCKVLSLWNGTANVAAPTGWDTLTFDDSAWSYSGVPNMGDNVWYGPGNHGLDNSFCLDRNKCQPEAVAPWTGAASPKAQFIVRWRFNLPQFDPGKVCPVLWQGWDVNVNPSGWNTGITNINGKGGFVTFNALNNYHFSQDLVPGANLIAHHVDSGAGSNPATPLWGSWGWISQAITMAGSLGGTSLSCCGQSEPRLLQEIAAIKELVTLIQRQVAPFAYVLGQTHAGLSGQGALPCQGVIGLKIEPEAVPDWAGIAVGDPDTLWLDSWINWGNADGYLPREFLRSSPHLSFPPLPGQYTFFSWTLAPGVRVAITELRREP